MHDNIVEPEFAVLLLKVFNYSQIFSFYDFFLTTRPFCYYINYIYFLDFPDIWNAWLSKYCQQIKTKFAIS